VVYVSSKLTARTRCTMRNLRLRRYYRHGKGPQDCMLVEENWRRGYRVQFGCIVKPWKLMPEGLRKAEQAARAKIEAARAGPSVVGCQKRSPGRLEIVLTSADSGLESCGSVRTAHPAVPARLTRHGS
jgi:hypothetical protein